MKITTDILKVALEWVEKNWLEVEGYNLTMTKVTNSRPPVWAEQLIKDVKELKEDVADLKEFVVEQKAFNAQVFEFMKEQREFNKRIEQDITKIKRDIVEIKIRLDNIENCPTIKKELSELKK